MASIEEGKNVIVCAPTGSGKTAIAEYAIHRCLQQGLRAFYTTPLKALSNQKFHDFRKLFGEHNVGLLTGDISAQREAPIVVMTTEVYRNMLYGTTLGEVRRSLYGVRTVVLDECHYMNDHDRGTVWEESLIYSPRELQLVALSATIANAEELCAWFSHTHTPTHLIRSDYRPVPLKHFYFQGESLSPLMDPQGKLNPRLQKASPGPILGNHRVTRRRQEDALPTPDRVVAELARHDMLPAIYFVFSRRGCESSMASCRHVLRLTVGEAGTLQERLDAAVLETPSLASHPHLPLLYEGLACHHAGLLPAWKALVERLYQEGLIKVVFATETLAAGINMPARTTVIGSLSKYTGDGHRILSASEFLQMSGRAGRRGMDSVGYAVTLFHPKEPVQAALKLAKAKSDPLESNFKPTYGMVLNLLQRHSLEQCRDLVEKSFGQFLMEQGEHRQDILRAQQDAEQLRRPICLREVGDLPAYRKLNERYQSLLKQSRGLGHAPRKQAVRRELERMRDQREDILRRIDASPCHPCSLQSQCWERRMPLFKLEDWLKRETARARSGETPYWRQFLGLTSVLQELGYLQNWKPTPTGELAGALRATHTVLLGEAVASGILSGLEPSELAAALTCLVNEETRALEGFKAKIGGRLQQAIQDLQSLAKALERLQRRFQVDLPTQVVPGYAGVVMRWAEGGDWWETLQWSGMEAGDLVRALRRTLDICRQLSFAPHVPQEIVSACQVIEKQICRNELKESIEQMDWLNLGPAEDPAETAASGEPSALPQEDEAESESKQPPARPRKSTRKVQTP